MTIINPNSIAGITSVTAEAGVMNFYKSDGTLAGLQLNGVNFNTTAGVSTFNDVYVGGTITYEDVKNVDSVGIVTAREGIFIPDSKKLQLGNAAGSADLQLYHDGSNSYLKDQGTGQLVIDGNAVILQYSAATKLTTTSSGVDVTGIVKSVSDGSAGVVLHRTFSGNVASSEVNTPQLDFTLTDTATSNQSVAKISPQALAGTGDAFKGLLRFFTANDAGTSTERLRINSDGEVGIGTDNPTEKLDVLGNIKVRQPAGTDALIRINEATTNNAFNLKQTATQALIQTTASQPLNIRSQAGSGSSSYLAFWTRDDERLRITSAGKVGIGTDNPSTILHLKDDSNDCDLTVEATASGKDARINLYGHSGGVSQIRLGDEADGNVGLITYDHSNNSLQLRAGDSERLRITSAGRVGINTTVPTAPLNVQAETSTGTCVRLNQEPTDKKASIYFQDATTTGSDSWIINENYDLTVYAGYNGKLNLGAYLTTGITVLSNGKVGIRTDNPTTTLHVRGNGVFTQQTGGTITNGIFLDPGDTGQGNRPDIILKGAGSAGLSQKAMQVYYNNGSDEAFYLRYDGGAYFGSRLLLGTTTEGHADADDLTIATSGNTGITIRSGTTSSGGIFFSDGTSGIAEYDCWFNFNHNNQQFDIGINNATRLRITVSGYVGVKRLTPLANLHTTNNELAVGANPTSAAAPNATYDGLVVDGEAGSFINIRSRGDGNDSYGRVAFSDDTRNRGYVEYRHKDGTGDDWLGFATAGAERLRITSTGQLQATGAADVRLTLGSSGTAGTNNSVHIRADSADLKFMAASGGTTIFETNGNETLRIKSTGELIQYANVGAADVAADDLVIGDTTGGVNRGMTIYSNSSQNGSIAFADNNSNFRGAVQYMHNGDRFRFLTGGQETLRLQSGGTDGVTTFFMGGVTNNNNKYGALTLNHYTYNSYNQIDLIKGSSTSGSNLIEIGGSGQSANTSAATTIKFFTAANATTNNGTERLRITSAGKLGVGSGQDARAYLDVRESVNNTPPFNIGYNDGSFYRNLGTVGPNDDDGTNATNGGQYLHVKLRTVWNDTSMTMFRITGYYAYSDYTESYAGCYRYNHSNYRSNPYGQIIHNQKRSTLHSMYNTADSPGYLVLVLDSGTNYIGYMIEHIGAGGAYGSYMQQDLEILEVERSTATDVWK